LAQIWISGLKRNHLAALLQTALLKVAVRENATMHLNRNKRFFQPPKIG
jgi:hypothetical protein